MTEGANEQGQTVGRVNTRVAAWAAWTLCGLTIILVCCVLAFAVLYRADLPIQDQGLLALVGVVASALVGAVIASRRPHNPIGWFFVLSASSFAIAEATFRYAFYGLVIDPGSLPLTRAMSWPQNWLWVPGVVLILLFVPLYFPNGQLPSRRWRPVLWLSVFFSLTLALLGAFLPGRSSGLGVTNPLGIEALRPLAGDLGDIGTGLLFLPIFLTAVASLVLRFWRSRGEERQQMKWITYAAGATFTMVLLVIPLEAAAADWVLTKIISLLTEAMVAGIPVAVGIAVLKYRLYDIDVLINRTLVYGALTAILGVVYFGGVATTQATFRALTDQQQPPQLAIVVSTLVIAALFNPLRRRIQAFIDRRFYRRKYDAAKTLETFSAKLRDETDLDALSDDLVGVVRETMQPAHVSLWLRPDAASKGERAPRALFRTTELIRGEESRD